MQEWTRLKQDAPGTADGEGAGDGADGGGGVGDLAFGLAVDAELFRLDSVVRWLDAGRGVNDRDNSSR